MEADVSYEVHVLRQGRWSTSGIYQGREDALRDARMAEHRSLGVRVVQDSFDQERKRFVSQTIYRHMNGEVEAAVDGMRPSDSSSASATGGAREIPGGAAVRRSAGSGSGPDPLLQAAIGLISGAVLLLGGIGIIFWLGLV